MKFKSGDKNINFKSGDKVTVKPKSWYDSEHKDALGRVLLPLSDFTKRMSIYCGQTMTIDKVLTDVYTMVEDGGINYWTDDMLEPVNEECIIKKYPLTEEKEPECGVINETPINEWNLPKYYEFYDEQGNTINATKIRIRRKRYPQTLEECCEVLGIEDTIVEGCIGYEYKLLSAFQRLLVYRNAFYKIGQGKPDFSSNTDDQTFYTISTFNGEINLSSTGHRNAFLSFKTKDERDLFYALFNKDIEICKELL